VLDHAADSARPQNASDLAGQRWPRGRRNVVIDAHRGHEIEFGVAEGNQQGVFLNPGFDSRDRRDPPHHSSGNIASRGLLEIRLKQTEQLAFAAAYVQIAKTGGEQAAAAVKPPNQVAFAAMKKHRLPPRESVSKLFEGRHSE
jgi:hypothetical protein